MHKAITLKKIEQIQGLLKELDIFVGRSFGEFDDDISLVRASERNLQLIVELASDINTAILIGELGKTPESYRQSFGNLEKAGILRGEYVTQLFNSVKLRNILIHEYEFDENFEIFYTSLKKIIPAYREYTKAILEHTGKHS